MNIVISLLFILSCSNNEIKIQGNWQSMQIDSVYEEFSFTGDSIYYFDDASLSISAYKYSIIDHDLYLYNNDLQVNSGIMPKIISYSSKYIVIKNADNFLDTIHEIDDSESITLDKVRTNTDYQNFLDAFWERRNKFMAGKKINVKYKRLEKVSFPIDSLPSFTEE